MRKFVLIGMLALSTMVWARGAQKSGGHQSSGGKDWYQATLNTQIDQSVRLNQAGAASPAVQFSENEPAAFKTPPAMAARGAGGDDWYNQKIKIANGVHQRDLGALKGEKAKKK